MTKHHVNLASGHEIDIVAQRGEVAYIVECKPQLHKQNLFNAIGQVLAYCSEYGGNARPAIVGFHDSSNQYARDTCKALGIWLIELERSVGVPTQEQETDECLGLAADSS